MPGKCTRREFLSRSTGTLGLATLAGTRSAVSSQANERINVALVGVGGRGEWFRYVVPAVGENLAALCDVNDDRAAVGYEQFPNVPRFHDFRKMLEDMGDAIDAVVVATPDHTHAVISLAAMQVGKHVYCEKPLTHNLREARVLRDAARRYGVATQMGNQGTATNPFRRAVELIRQGAIGDVKEVLAWNDSGGSGRPEAPAGSEPVPGYLQWDLWLGPAAERPYHPEWMNWHAWRDFGTGQLGNWAVHTMNLAFMALDLQSLWAGGRAEGADGLVVEAEVSETNHLAFPRWEIVRYSVPARGELGPVTITWVNGSSAPQGRERIEDNLGRKVDWGDYGEKKWADHAGLLIVGTRGKLHATGHNATFTLMPAEDFPNVDGPPEVLPVSPGHEREWFDAIRGGPAAMSSFDYGSALTEFVLLGNVATRFDRALHFDPVAFRFKDDEAADRALSRDYRPGWEV